MYTGIAVAWIILAIILSLFSPIDDPIERELMTIAFLLIGILILLGQYFDQVTKNRHK